MTPSVLYISYDGLMEPLGQSQVLQYLLKLAKSYQITLVTYEKSKDWANLTERNLLKEKVKAAGIRWVPLRYHKSPTVPATMYDLIVGCLVCIYLVLCHRVQIVHARSYLPSVIALLLKKIFRIRFVFDMRGFWADEKVDSGSWAKESQIYKLAKWFEPQFLTQADIVVSLTHAGVAVMREFPYLKDCPIHFEVIPTCTNLEIFYTRTSKTIEQKKPFTLGYVGSVSGWYLFEPMLECFKFLKQIKPDARLLILNKGDHSYIRERMKTIGVEDDWVEIKTVSHAQVATEMNKMDATIFFIKPVFSKKASAATKLGEFLACGVPCLSNDGVGDMTQIIEGEGVGIILREFNEQAYLNGVKDLLALTEIPDIQRRCEKVAKQYFSLDDGVQCYDRIYQYLSRSDELNQ